MIDRLTALKHYPLPEEIDSWAESILAEADSTPCEAEVLELNGFSHSLGVYYAAGEFRYVRFTPQGGTPFYAYWQPAWSKPAPLLVHVPGYGAEISTHPDLVQQGYHVLHISPLGYATPHGPDESRKVDGFWPVLPDTIASGGESGYREWLLHCALAIRWARQQEGVPADRISFFGTSQGGGGALLLGSLFRDRGARCVAADVPFLTNFPLLLETRQGDDPFKKGFAKLDNPAMGWRALGFIDTLSHARRLTMPVLLTAGELDEITPQDTIASLFEALPGTRSYTLLKGTGHRYTREFSHLAAAWFRMYA